MIFFSRPSPAAVMTPRWAVGMKMRGVSYNDYQVNELVTLVRYADWSQVGELAASQGLIPPTLPVPETDEAVPGRSGRPES